MRFASWVCALLMLSTPAMAQGADEIALDLPACYERVYDRQHLADHPAQHVQSMRMRFSREAETNSVAAVVNLQFRQGSRRYRDPAGTVYVAAMTCRREPGGEIWCGVECDGGRVLVGFRGRTPAEITIDAREGFVMSGSCADEERAERFNPRPDDRRFRLRRIAASCAMRAHPGR